MTVVLEQTHLQRVNPFDMFRILCTKFLADFIRVEFRTLPALIDMERRLP